MGKILDINIPEDIIYNWKRKYLLGLEFAMALNTYIITPTDQLIVQLKQRHLDPGWASFFNRMSNNIGLVSLYDTIQWVLAQIPDEDKQGYVRHSIGMFHALVDMFHDTTIHRHRLRQQIPVYLNDIQSSTNFTFQINMPTIETKIRTYHKRLKAAGVNADFVPCTNEYVCLNCLVLDDFFNTVIREGLRMRDYYNTTKVIIPDLFNGLMEEKKNTCHGTEMSLE